ncbi:3'-5'-exoribonuclease [Coemansia spiralis]|uniref:Exosome complex component RRP45 n=2 Tax=Coemansia TaxID=4863 RepID=A0A9W8GD43_9FUNG|nr:ribosomal protein S5 domain 2-type protein [Coemansia spiralis]KAJ1989859.1 3'-5'-exoribonuclease [Coemansia umbellata]KAJ2623089.1 3'-5'-exoribonuclease [Coemansia sp. RSA 1358]KAJ2681079.1 3'-5'-exoribonuclease [Coemansia spiralis]
MVVEIEPSNIEREFLLEALEKGIRVDGRGIYDYRTLKITCSPTYGLVEVQLGQTRVLARVTCEVTRPFPDRPTEGLVQFNADLSNLAAPGLDSSSGKPSVQEVAVSRMIERVIRQSRAIDTEALCILAGEKVWSVRLDLHFLDHSGNLIDAASIASIAALRHFRRPDVTIDGEEAIIHDVNERNPVPLSIHHTPICVTFGFFGSNGDLMLVDPNLLEEQVQVSSFTITLNSHREICALSKAGGVPLAPSLIQRCTQIALTKVDDINDKIQEALMA